MIRINAFVVTVFVSMVCANSYAKDPAIDGYSPVSYFTKNIAEQGSPDYQYQYKDQVYYFVSEEQIDIFKARPEKYVPQFGAFCPYSLTLGKKTPIDPTNFKIVGDYLLLFHRTEKTDGLKLWNRDEDEQAMLMKAKGQHILMRF